MLAGLIGAFGRAELDRSAQNVASTSESARVAAAAHDFADADDRTVIVVASADGAMLDPQQSDALGRLAGSLADVSGAQVTGPIPSADAEAAVIQVTAPLKGDEASAERTFVEDVRAVVADHAPADLEVQVTGGPAFGVDLVAAFDGADFTLLMVTVAIVAGLLIVTYRSPVLWLIPLAVVAIADQAAGKLVAAIGESWSLSFDTGIVSVLVFGAGTNYALLMISRYREELSVEPDHRRALTTAWRATVPAILASNVTVVLSLLTLVLAGIPTTRGLGIACAAGLVIVLAAVLLVLPAALAVCGPAVFWPFVPRAGDQVSRGRIWSALATTVVRRPMLPLVGGLALLGVMSAGLIGVSIGLPQVEKFRVASESAAGLEVLGRHFDAGEAQPLVIITDASHAAEVRDAAATVGGIARVSEPMPSKDGSLARLIAVGEPAPGSAESRELVAVLRSTVHAVPGADALVGGPGAVDVDARTGNLRDVAVVVPLILLVTFAVLVVLLRALVAPAILLGVNAMSAVAAVGAGAWLGSALFGWNALDLQVPLLSFLFLVALGVDYTIFLVHRARSESAQVGTRPGMITALATTGGVITSAGIVLAGVFAALGLLPLVTLGQIGLIVGVGVLVDTLVVRTLVVPALFSVFGDRMWWPSRSRGRIQAAREEESDHVDSAASLVAG